MNDYTLVAPITGIFDASANPPDGATICLDIDIIDDDDYEKDQQFTVAIQLSVPSTQLPVSPDLAMTVGNALVTIQDNGGKQDVHVHLSSMVYSNYMEDCVSHFLSLLQMQK